MKACWIWQQPEVLCMANFRLCMPLQQQHAYVEAMQRPVKASPLHSLLLGVMSRALCP